MAKKFSGFTNNPSRVPLDTLVGLDISAAANAQNSYWSLNTLFSEITGNITDGAVRFGGFAAPAVSAAGKGAIYFDSSANAFRVSQNAGAYAGLILGTIANTQVAVGSAAGTVTGSASLTFASSVLAISGATNPGVTATGTGAGAAGFTADQTVSGAASYAFYYMQSPSSAALLQLTTAGYTPANLIKANQLRLYGATGTVETLFELADASTAFAFGINNARVASINATASESLVLGVASSLTGRVKMFNSAGATYTQISAGNAAASLNYILPVTSPSAGYVLSASAPSGSNVTLSWTAAAAAASLTDTQVGFGDATNMLSGSADFLYASASGQLSITKTVNTNSSFVITNDDVGNSAQAAFAAQATTARLSAYATGSGWTPGGGIGASYSVLESNTLLALKAATGQAISFLIDATTYASLTSTQLAITTVPTTGAGLSVAASTLTSGSLVSLSMTGTAAASNTKTALAVSSSGANGTASQTVTGATISCTNTGTTNTNIALALTSSGAATQNTALSVTAGNIVLPLGAAATPVITPTGSLTSGIFWVTATDLAVSVSGGELYRFGSAGRFGIGGGANAEIGMGTAPAAPDMFIGRVAAASLRFGEAAANPPVAQTLSVQGASGTDIAGANWTFAASRGTGAGAGGNIIWQVAPAGGTGSSQNALINGLVLTSTGQLYGAALHNNSATVTGTTNQYIASGTYTPTVTAVTNCTATSSGICQWIRVGNVVTVSGVVAVDPTVAATFTSVGISLPVASNFATNASECAGVAANANFTGYSGAITADFTNDRAQLDFTVGADVSNQAWSFTFTYVVL